MNLDGRTVAFGAILTASLTANAVLLVRSVLTARRDTEGATLLAPSASAAALDAPFGTNEKHAPAPRTDSCSQQIRDREERRADLERKIEKHATPKQLFEEASTPNRALADDVQRHLALTEGRTAPAAVECRGMVCRVENRADATAPPDFDPAWARRNVGRAMSTRNSSYYVMRDKNAPAGVDIVQRLADDFRRSDAIELCSSRFRDEGALEVHLHLMADDDEIEGAPRGLSLGNTTGPLAGTPKGNCMVEALRGALSRAELPTGYTSAYGYRLVLP